MIKITGVIMGLAFALTIPTGPATTAPACPEVDSAREMLSRAAATQNDRELQATRNPEGQAPRERTAQQDPQIQTPRAQDKVPVPPLMKEAALLVKEAATDCEAGTRRKPRRRPRPRSSSCSRSNSRGQVLHSDNV